MLPKLETALQLYQRLLLGEERRLPDFIIIGAQKGGTTSLFEYLSQHPDVAPSLRKETHFFTSSYGRGLSYYRAHFPRVTDGAALTGEATPYYLFHPDVAARVKQHVPNAKLIVLLRDPVERAYSHYCQERRRDHDRRELAEAIGQEPAIIAAEEARLLADAKAVSPVHRDQSYVSRGLYAAQLERWFSCFDRSQFMIERSEDLFADPAAVYARTLEFLGLPAFRPAAFEKLNAGDKSESAPADARALLAPKFVEANRRLEALLGRPMGW